MFHIEKNTDNRVTASVTKESAKEERAVLTFSLAGREMNLSAVIIAIILTGLALAYAVLRVIRIKETKKKR